ncbi:ribonuclease HII [Flavobacteriaceae sp. LMIT009]
MKKLLVLIIIGSFFLTCNQSKRSTTKLTQLIPENTEVVLQINNKATFSSDVKNNAILQILTVGQENQLNSTLKYLEKINTTNPIITTFHNEAITFITKHHDSLIEKTIDSRGLYSKVIDSVSIISSNKDFLNQFQVNEVNQFSKLELASSNSSFNVFLNTESTNRFGGSLFGNNSNFGDWIVLDAHISQNQINFNAISIARDTIQKFIKVFEQTIPQENNIINITPINNRGISSLTYHDYKTIQGNISKLTQTTDSILNTDFLETFSEIGTITLKDNEKVLIANSIDASNTMEIMESIENKNSAYRNIDIYSFEKSNYFQSVFEPFFTLENILFYTNLDSFFVFAQDQESLKEIITNYLNGTTLSKDRNFLDVKSSLSDESSLLKVVNPSKLQEILNALFTSNITLNKLSPYKYSGFQLVQDDGFMHINGVIKKSKTNAQRNSISEEFNVTLDNDLLNDPQFVVNHRTKHKEVVIQDINNQLYLISNKGKVLWKKQLHGPILGKIEQVDLYKNGRLQLAFATSRRVYILDRNGRDVSPFPIKFNNNITQPLSVFDYDNNRNYRFTVTQNNVVLMYDKNGRRISGFKYQNTNDDVVTQPKHFRVNGRDYIVFATEKEMKILNRRGQSRINVGETADYSGNEIFRYNNTFTTTSTNGELIQVNSKGNLSMQALNLTNDHAIDATSKTLVAISENKLTIKQRTQELDFGNYTAPKIFYLNDKIYVALTDLQAQKVYLFDSQSKSITNFPVYGNSIIDLANIDGDNNLEFVTKGESNSIIVYQKN